MKNFPVTASTLSAKHLGQFIIEKYGLGENTTCTLFRTGINHTYFINDNGAKYTVRIYSYNWRSELEIREEIDLLNLLKEHSISISYPIADKNGDFIQAINAPEGIRYAVLFSFAEGGKLRVMSPEVCYTIGAMMAKMHTITASRKISRINYNIQSLLVLPYKYATEHFARELPEIQFVKDQTEEIATFFNRADQENITSGIIHLDIWYDNMAITSENEITLFDFDFCGNGWLIFDVAYFCTQLFHIEADKEQYEIKMQGFLNGYKSVRSLSAAELSLIPHVGAAIWIFYLGVQCRRFDWSNVFLSENYLKLLFIPRIRSWAEYYKIRQITFA